LYATYDGCPITAALSEVIDDLSDAAEDLAAAHARVFGLPLDFLFDDEPGAIDAAPAKRAPVAKKAKAVVPPVVIAKTPVTGTKRKSAPVTQH
jgi:hypothetical protein